jgi:hypothetical protein
MDPHSVGYAMTIMGAAGLVLQLAAYSPIQTRLGTLRCYRIFSFLFPIAYTLASFLVLINRLGSPAAWVAISATLLVHITGRIFVMPSAITLINNSALDPSVRGLVHGLGSLTAAVARTVGPVMAGAFYGVGNSLGHVGLVWWVANAIALCGLTIAFLVRETI